MNNSANSSRSYWVTRPDGMTCQLRPASVMVRVGMLRKLHFVIDARRIEHALGRGGVRAGQRLRVGCFTELEECTGKPGLLEHPVAAVGLRVVFAISLQTL